MRKISFRIVLALPLFILAATAHSESFNVEGTDLGMGAGARYMAMGGAAVAFADDVYAVYWNPAALARLKENQFTISGQLNSSLNNGNFSAFAFGENDWRIGSVRIVPAIAHLKRLTFDIEGNFGATDLETVFLEYVLPGIPEGFSGRVRSQTIDYRFVLGMRPSDDSPLSIGVSVAKLRCVTDFCGLTSDDPANPKTARIIGRDITFNLGLLYELSAHSAIGATIRDVRTRLEIDTYVRDTNGYSDASYTKGFPTDYSIGYYTRRSPTVNMTADFQMLTGNYGSSKLEFTTFRFGYEKQNRRFSHRLGLIVPITIESSITASIKDDLPFSLFSLTMGVGFEHGNTAVDLVFYAHPMMSYQRQSFYPGLDLSLTWKF